MNVFVLCTGRCGSTTFIKACSHMRNYTAAHESRSGFIGDLHFQYPDNHIEADNRLSWFLGRLEQVFGDGAFYVHLTRDKAHTAASLAKLYYPRRGIMRAYAKSILQNCSRATDPVEICIDYCDTVNANIETFLKDKSQTMKFSLEHAKEDWHRFWQLIGAEGDFSAALSEWDERHNVFRPRKSSLPLRLRKEIRREVRRLRELIQSA